MRRGARGTAKWVAAIVVASIAIVAAALILLPRSPLYKRSLLRDAVHVEREGNPPAIATLVLVEQTKPYPTRRSTYRKPKYGVELMLYDGRDGSLLSRHQVVNRGDESRLRNDARLIGFDGVQLWLMGDTLFRFDPASGQLEGVEALTAPNPSLAGIVPEETKYFRFEGGRLQVQAANGVTYRIDPATRRADEFEERANGPARDEAEYRRSVRAYNDGMAMFGVGASKYYRRGRMISDTQYLGLFSPKEIAEYRNKVGGIFSRDLSGTHADDTRRKLVAMELGPDDDDRDDDWYGIRSFRIVADASWVKAGLLREADTAYPMRLADPPGFVLLHQERIDRLGTVIVSRLNDDGTIAWSVDTELAALSQVLPHPTHPAFIGSPIEPEGQRMAAQQLVTVDLQRGTLAATVLE